MYLHMSKSILLYIEETLNELWLKNFCTANIIRISIIDPGIEFFSKPLLEPTYCRSAEIGVRMRGILGCNHRDTTIGTMML